MSRAVVAVAEWLERRVLLSVSLVKDINAGDLGSMPNEFAAAGAGVIFRADKASDAWVSDGSAAGTVAVPGLTEGGVQPGTFDGEAYFQGLSQSTGMGLWKSDGTVAGTVLVVPGLNWGPGFAAAGDRFYFFGPQGGSTESLWSSDGTAAGTHVVSPLPDNLGVDSVSVGDQINFEIAGNNGKCCYVLRDNTASKRQVWVSDGTASGTQLLIDNIGKNQALVASSADGGFYVFVAGGPQQGLYKTDGTRSGTTLVAQMGGDPSFNNQLAVVGNDAFFTGNDNVTGTQLWVSDGTPAGTYPVSDVQRGAFYGGVNTMQTGGSLVYFKAPPPDSTSGAVLWRSDGTFPLAARG